MVSIQMYRITSFRKYMAFFIVIWLSSFTIRYKVQGIANTRSRQCKLLGYDTACEDCSESCEVLKCGRLSPENYYVFDDLTPPASVEDGTKCGKSKICVRGSCVQINEAMPRYLGADTYHSCRPVQPVIVAYNRAHQCIRRGYAGACMGYTRSCHALHCARPTAKGSEYQKVIPRWGVEIGTKCDKSKICINGKCVDVVGEMPETVGEDAVHLCKESRSRLLSPVKTRHQQCIDHGFDVACAIEMSGSEVCSSLSCGYETFPGYYVAQPGIIPITSESNIRVAEKTKCGESRICINKECIFTTKLPTYMGVDKYANCHKLDC